MMKKDYSNKSMRSYYNSKYRVTVEAENTKEAIKKIKKKVKEANKKVLEAKETKKTKE